jgi:hypothetical protein
MRRRRELRDDPSAGVAGFEAQRETVTAVADARQLLSPASVTTLVSSAQAST